MPTRKRLLVWLAGTAMIVGAVLVLRAPDTPPPKRDEVELPIRINRFTADNVVLPLPGPAPEPPERIVVVPAPGQLQVAWADAVAGGTPPAGAVGYEVRWEVPGAAANTRLVIAPETQLDGLMDGQSYRIEVRSVDAYGRRSTARVTAGMPGAGDDSWRSGLTGLFDDFSDPDSVRAEVPGSRWHISGYRGCVDLGTATAGSGLPIELDCGADMAVLRARPPMHLADPPAADGVLGRVAVRTDTAGPGGELTIDLVPGPADRVGAGRVGTDHTTNTGPDPTLPAGTIRAVVNDSGAQVRAQAGLSVGTPEPAPAPATRRGPGVLHLFEVVITTSGVQVRQDGSLVAAAGVAPAWREASVLLGVRGPEGRPSRVHLAAAGFTGRPAQSPAVVEVPVNPGTLQVLGIEAAAPGIGIARTPLLSAARARLVATIANGEGFDPSSVVVQLGDTTVPARAASAAPPSMPGAAVTVIAELPPEMVGDHGQNMPLTPFVLRARGATDGVFVAECYLEITPGPGWRGPTPAPQQDAQQRHPKIDALPTVRTTLSDASGAPLTTATVRPHGYLVLTVALDATVAQWDTGAVGGVQGFELWLDGRLIASMPTAADGPGIGGRYAVSVALVGLARGSHVFEVREFGPTTATRPASLLDNFVVD